MGLRASELAVLLLVFLQFGLLLFGWWRAWAKLRCLLDAYGDEPVPGHMLRQALGESIAFSVRFTCLFIAIDLLGALLLR